MSNYTQLARSQYVNLRTFRKDGAAVDTPVWAAPIDDQLVVYTNLNSYKVKRIRRNSACAVAPCGVRGGLHGPWTTGSVVIVSDEAFIARAFNALRTKYGVIARAMFFFGRLAGKHREWLILSVRVT